MVENNGKIETQIPITDKDSQEIIIDIVMEGKSAYDLAVERGFDGTLEEWLLSLHGKDGKDADVDGIQAQFDTVEARLDSTDAQLNNMTQDFTQHKLDYEEQRVLDLQEIESKRQQDQLKVAKVEKDINDYQQVMSQVNVNQEAKQDVSGYGVVSLPKNAANGQVRASVKGLTATNLTKNGVGHWDTVGVNTQKETTTTLSGEAIKIIATASTVSSSRISSKDMIYINAGDKIYCRFYAYGEKVFRPTFRGSNFDGSVSVPTIPNEWTKVEGFVTANNTIDVPALIYPAYSVFEDAVLMEQGDYLIVDNVVVLNLTQLGLENKTVEEMEKMFPSYFDSTKSTISASRLKSVGKNLFDKNKIILQSRANTDTGNIETLSSYKRTPFIKVLSNKRYTRVVENNVMGHYISWYDSDKNYISRSASTSSETTQSTLSPINAVYAILNIHRDSNIDTIQLEQSDIATTYEPYTESAQYLPNVGELRSLPNGVKDEIRVSGGKAELVKRVSDEVILDGSMVALIGTTSDKAAQYIQFERVNFPNSTRWMDSARDTNLFGYRRLMYPPTENDLVDTYRVVSSGLYLYFPLNTFSDITEAKNWTNANSPTLIYQLAEPVEIPIEVSGTLLSNPSGTVYVEPVVADAGIYDDGISVLHQDFPISEVEKLSKVDFMTGVETDLDVSECEVSEDSLSFTHPNLTDGDIVFFTYYYDLESTLGETTLEYYDSRYVLKDDVTGKFYKVVQKVSDGELVNELVEV